MSRLNESEDLKHYVQKELDPEQKNLPGTNLPTHNLPKHRLPGQLLIYNTQYDSTKQEVPVDEAQLSEEQRLLLRANSLPSSELPCDSEEEHTGKKSETDEEEIFLIHRFKRSQDTDEKGTLQNKHVRGTIYSRYTIFDHTLDYVRVDHLTEYDQSNSEKRKLESAFIRFDALDLQTQEQIRMRLPNVPRKLSEHGMEFISSYLGTFNDRPIPPENNIQDASGWTIGYGHLLEEAETERMDFKNGISEYQAREWLQEDLRKISDALNQELTTFTNQHEFDALLSIASIHGVQSRVVKKLLHLVNNLRFREAKSYIELIGIPKKRGSYEAIMFSKGKYQRVNKA